MKTNRLAFPLLLPALAVTALTTTGCAREEEKPSPRVATAPAEPPAVPPAATGSVAMNQGADWVALKDMGYDRRTEFLTGLQDLEARVEVQVSELDAMRAALPLLADTKDWDFAMKEMGNSRGYLKSTNAEMTKASRETWDQQKDKVGQAWTRTQDAYANVKSSTTLR